MTKVKGEAKLVAVADIEPNEWNPNRMSRIMFEKEKASITKHGFIVPVTCRRLGKGYQIVDGEHRWRAAKELGIDVIPIWDLGKISDDDARELTIILNDTHGEANPDRLRALLKDLSERRSAAELGEILPYSPERLSAMTGERAAAFGDLMDRVRSKSRSDTTERVYRLNKEDAERVDKAIETAIRMGADGVSEALNEMALAYMETRE